MSWLDLIDNARFLSKLFPDQPPSLSAIRLHEIQLHQDGPRIILRLDLNEYPASPPDKWSVADCNTVQVPLNSTCRMM